MRKIIAAAMLVALCSLFAPVASAWADTPGCVTRAEYLQVQRGDTRLQVRTVFDTPGGRLYYAHSGNLSVEIRGYRTCRPAVVTVAFARVGHGPWQLVAKEGRFPDFQALIDG